MRTAPRSALALVLLLATLLLPGGGAPARADIAPDPEYGTTLAPWGPCGVRMADEHVVLRLERDRVLVEATFTLVNGESASKLRVGFPDAVQATRWSTDVADPPEGASPKLLEFRARVDGREQPVTPRYYQRDVGPLVRSELADAFRAREAALERATTPEEKARLQAEIDRARETYGWWNGTGWLTWEMEFAPRATRTVEVSYRTSYRGEYRRSLLGAAGFEYILKTGAFWDGVIGRAIVDVELGAGLTPAHLVLEPSGAVPTPGGFRWDWKDLEPTFDVKILVRTHPDLAAAAEAYRRSALEAEKAGERVAAAHAWASTYYALAEGGRWAEAAAAAARVAALEAELAGSEGPASRTHPRPRLDLRGTYVPWAGLWVEALVKAGDEAGAARAAVAARPVLDAWLAAASSSIPWGRLDGARTKELLELVRRLTGSDPPPDGR